MNLYCHGLPVKTGKKTTAGKAVYAVWCEKCQTKGEGATADAAITAFKAALQKAQPAAKKATPAQPASSPPPEAALIGFPTSPLQLPAYVTQHIVEITATAAAFIDKPALRQMVTRNVRYVMNNKDPKFLKVWTTQEGQESIVRALEDAFSLGATLPEMGCMVPYGIVVEFIPAVEAYEFALTTGRTAPFSWINIEAIHENDIVETGRQNGNFVVWFKFIPNDRGPVKSVVVYGQLNNPAHPVIAGELYEASRLLEKAKIHSPGYQTYLRNLKLFEIARTEGKVHTDAEGREYADVLVEAKNAEKYAEQNRANFEAAEKAGKLKKDNKGEYAEVEIPKRGGTDTWKKKIYRSEVENPGTETKRLYIEDIVNPYEGADQPEMLRKAAGKSFLGKYVKVRNSTAAVGELRKDPENAEEALDGALDAALRQFDGGGGNAGNGAGDKRQTTPRTAPPQPEGEILDAEFEEQSHGAAEPKGETASGAEDRPATESTGKEESKKKPEF